MNQRPHLLRSFLVIASLATGAAESKAEDERLLATMSDLCAQALERARLYDSEHRIALRLHRGTKARAR